jgi:hypothetical protein
MLPYTMLIRNSRWTSLLSAANLTCCASKRTIIREGVVSDPPATLRLSCSPSRLQTMESPTHFSAIHRASSLLSRPQRWLRTKCKSRVPSTLSSAKTNSRQRSTTTMSFNARLFSPADYWTVRNVCISSIQLSSARTQ